MPDQSPSIISREFVFQSSDQASTNDESSQGIVPEPSGPTDGHAGTGSGLTKGPEPQRPRGPSSNVNQQQASQLAASPENGNTVDQASTGRQHTSFAQRLASPAVGNFVYNPGGPLVWDWDQPVDFNDFANFFEPQGELVQEAQSQQSPKQEFSIPGQLGPLTPIPNTTARNSSSYPHPGPGPSKSGVRLPPPPPPLSSVQAGVKRKAESEPTSAVSVAQAFAASQASASKRFTKPRSTSTSSNTGHPSARPSTMRSQSTSDLGASPSASGSPEGESSTQNIPSETRRRLSEAGPASNVRPPVRSASQRSKVAGQITEETSILPAGKVFPIQIGSELFRLSGASISSDAPSYFTQFFQDQLSKCEGSAGGIRTLYIDRDPITFRDISLHLQGYHIQPRDGPHFVKLFADAQFYNLPRLMSQLFSSEIFIQIGDRHFQIPRDLFSGPGDSPNYFSLGFAVFFSTPSEGFPGLDRPGLLRPPAIAPPAIAGRSAEIFQQLVHVLRGYPLHIRNEEHRAELLRDCRYFHLKGLEQKLIAHNISFNLNRDRSEILIRLEDIRQSGISFLSDPAAEERTASAGWVQYSRPYVDEQAHDLIAEIGAEATRVDLRNMRAEFYGLTKARITSLFQVVANKMNLPATQPLGLMMLQGGMANQPVSPANTPLSEDLVKVSINAETAIQLDGKEFNWTRAAGEFDILRDDDHSKQGVEHDENNRSIHAPVPTSAVSIAASSPDWLNSRPGSTRPSQTRRTGEHNSGEDWAIKKGHWRLRVQPSGDGRGGMEIVMVAVRIEAFSGERGRNAARGFLS